MRDTFDSYIPAFQLLAVFTIVGAILLFFIPCLRKQDSAEDAMDERDVPLPGKESTE
jgi:hypothetical protein